jgi:predicted ATP-binding protein involved in virulence
VAVSYGIDRSPRDLTPRESDGRQWTADDAWRTALDTQGVSFDALFEWFREREDFENERIRDDRAFRDEQLESVRTAASTVSGLGPPRVRRGRRPRLGVDKDGTALFFDQLSSGERALVALAGDIARRLAIAHPDVPAADRSGVVLIDEIDQHLHPRLQREVVERLRRAFPAVQWVLTTHSPLVAMHVPTECVRVLRDFELIPTPPTEGRDANALLADLFGVAERPAAWQSKLDELARLIDDGKFDEAKVRLTELAATLGDNDPTVVEHQTMLAVLQG